MTNVYIHNPSITKFGKLNAGVMDIALQTGRSVLENFDSDQIDLFILSTFAPEVYTHEFHLAAKIASQLNLKQVFCTRSETASSSGASAVHLAYYLLQSGQFKNALVLGAESMSQLSREVNNLTLGSVLSEAQIKFSMSMAQGAAMIANLYLHNYQYDKSDLFYIAEKLHENGSKNKYAHLQKPITREDYEKAPVFSYPLNLYDISPISDGGAGLILSTEKRSGLRILGTGHGHTDFHNLNMEPSFHSSRTAFEKAYKSSNIKSHQIEIAELHDAFTIFEVIGGEDAGLFPRGKGLEFVKSGETHPNGSIPINVSGGLKTRGHPIGASGIAQIVEISGLMKRKNKSLGLTHSIGGLATNNFATIIENSG
ncbi:MAG: thiolase family protein [Leptospiraceae bacterium]|nr:thiolase family protein [Leptospiraceae bacterium]MCP5512049.1 thiolase family protein [Leptospiraceae bacterium]